MLTKSQLIAQLQESLSKSLSSSLQILFPLLQETFEWGQMTSVDQWRMLSAQTLQSLEGVEGTTPDLYIAYLSKLCRAQTANLMLHITHVWDIPLACCAAVYLCCSCC